MKFPKELYAVIDGEGEDAMLVADGDFSVLAEMNTPRHAAKYVLAEHILISNRTEVSK